jgi:rhamnulokinase
MTGKSYPVVHIIGGGSNDDYLSHLTAEKSGKRVFAGPTEATAIGNILAQMLGQGVFASVAEARECVAASFDVAEKV